MEVGFSEAFSKIILQFSNSNLCLIIMYLGNAKTLEM